MDAASLFRLDGRVALVTGGGRGLGRMIASGFIAQGATVYISSRDSEACALAARDLGPNCHALAQDVSTVEGCRKLAEAFSALETRLDILVNNAGTVWSAPFSTFPEKGWDRVVDLNLKSPFFLTQAFHHLLKRDPSAPRSKVIHIASIDGVGLNTWETYSYHASKAGLIHLTRRMAAALIDDGVIVNAIAPGVFASDMNSAARDHAAFVARAIPAGRIGGAQDMAAAAIYLASRAGDYVVGSTLCVDGGISHAGLRPYLGAPSD